MKFVETSAKTDEKVQEAFETLTKEIMKLFLESKDEKKIKPPDENEKSSNNNEKKSNCLLF